MEFNGEVMAKSPLAVILAQEGLDPVKAVEEVAAPERELRKGRTVAYSLSTGELDALEQIAGYLAGVNVYADVYAQFGNRLDRIFKQVARNSRPSLFLVTEAYDSNYPGNCREDTSVLYEKQYKSDGAGQLITGTVRESGLHDIGGLSLLQVVGLSASRQ